MKYYFEIYITTDEMTEEQWRQVHNIVRQQIGVLGKYQIIVSFEENVVRYFIASNRDLGQLSNNIEVGVLRPIQKDELKLPEKATREPFITWASGGNILDLKERLGIKRGKHLNYAVFNIRQVSATAAKTNLELYFKGAGDIWSRGKKNIFSFPSHLLAIDFKANTGYLRKTPPKYLNIEKSIHLLETNEQNALFSISGFPFSQKDYYLPINNYEFDKHSFIIGASGSGKSKFIELYIDRLSKSPNKANYRVIVIDPHDSLRQDLETIENSYVVNFANDSAELFGSDVQTDVSAATELTTSLLKSLIADQFNPKLERVLRFSLFVLFVSRAMSLGMLKRFITELELRNQILSHVETHIPQNIRQFFATDFNELRTSHYNEAILPIVSLVDEMQLQPTLVNESEQSLAALIKSNFLTVFSLNKVSMGEKVVKTVAGLLIQQIFLLAQSRTFNERVILIVDEVSVVQNPALASILSEARKFNLSVVLTQQYFGQVEKDLRNAIFANVYNYYAFRVSEEDARSLAGNLKMEIPKEIITAEKAKGVKEEDLKIKYMTELHPQECLCRLSANGQVLPCFKARTINIGATPSTTAKVEAEDLSTYKQKQAPKKAEGPKKFVESEAKSQNNFAEIPSTPASSPAASLPAAPEAPSLLADVTPPPAAPSASDKTATATPGEAMIAPGVPATVSSPEQEPNFSLSEVTPETSPEIDPNVRQMNRQLQEKASTTIGKAFMNNEVVHAPVTPSPGLPKPSLPEDTASAGGGWSQKSATPSSVSLSELLSSQSSHANKK